MARVLGAALLAAFLVIASTALAIWWTARKDSRPSSDAIVVVTNSKYGEHVIDRVVLLNARAVVRPHHPAHARAPYRDEEPLAE